MRKRGKLRGIGVKDWKENGCWKSGDEVKSENEDEI